MQRRTLQRGLLALVWLLALAAWVVRDAAAGPAVQGATPRSPVLAQVIVERAFVFPTPDRNAQAVTYLFERERVPVLAQHPDGAFLLVAVDDVYGWVLRVQVELAGDLAAVPQVASVDALPGANPTVTFTPYQPPPASAATRVPFPSRTPLPTRTPDPAATPGPTPAPGTAEPGEPVLIPGVPPPLDITLPDDWEAVDLVVPLRTFDDTLRDLPLTIYFGPLGRDVFGLIYVYWGFPNTVDWASGEYNLWADGVQILRGSLIGETCNLGVYDQQVFPVGGRDGVGANYQASECEQEADTAGWFAVLRAGEGTFAFYTAVEPWNALPEYRDDLQAILDTVVFEIPDEPDS